MLTSFQNELFNIGPPTTNISVWPEMMNSIVMNFIPDMQSRFKPSSFAGPQSFFTFDIKENAMNTCGTIPRDDSFLFLRYVMCKIVPTTIIEAMTEIMLLKQKSVTNFVSFFFKFCSRLIPKYMTIVVRY